MPLNQPKIFGIGLNKTGTTTLLQCGKYLGFRCSGSDRSLLKDYVIRNDFTRIRHIVSEFQLFVDWPWPLIYKEMDQMLPGSRFILTVRKSEDLWFESLKNHSLTTHPTIHCRKLAYGYNFPHKYRKEHIQFYTAHNENVRSYFKNRGHQFLEICWEDGDGFEKLCSFLNCPKPDIALPHDG